MAKGIYIGAGSSKKAKEIYVGVGEVKKAKEIYIGYGGGVKRIWPTEYDLSAILTKYVSSLVIWHTGAAASQGSYASMVGKGSFEGKNVLQAMASSSGNKNMWWDNFSAIYMRIAPQDSTQKEVPQEMLDAVLSYKKIKIEWGSSYETLKYSLTLNIIGASDYGYPSWPDTAYKGTYLKIHLDGTAEDAKKHYNFFARYHQYTFMN